jgi:holliday junction DNA helicase RuvA
VIATVRGPVASLGPDSAVVDVGGIGVLVVCTPATLAGLRVGQPAMLATSLVVREDSLTLYGFADEDERAVFELVQTVSGIGPRLAQSMLAVHAPDDLRRAVATDDLVALTKVPGIGRKGAQRVVLELRDRLGPPRGAPSQGTVELPGDGRSEGWQGQVHAALLGLGWSSRDADAAVDRVAAGLAASAADGADRTATDVSALLRAALQTLSRA